MRTQIAVSAACLFNSAHELLLVRKAGTQYFMLPGGKPEPGEDGQDALLRELKEELELTLEPEQLRHLGIWTAAAANENNADVQARVWRAEIANTVSASAEIEEAVWYSLSHRPDITLAPLITECILPFLTAEARQQ
ncbi:NUDIX domain-containing protein [Brenneria populi subsp. brevivirga]|uniref:NUDIX domain-containing protein n=1 Tax=Brenneria populi TaxID=1505588 RepID=UPI002E19E4BB|nr:NUDIX domain-containing protein [Brenneria populi subsp. brevivirga]